METGVYTITNKITNQIYVGCTLQSFKIRWSIHKRSLNKGTSNSILLQRAWKKYGADNFVFEELVICDKETIYSEEHYWATLLNTHNPKFGYNLKPTHPDNSTIISKEARFKMKEKATGRRWSDEYKEMFRQSKLGKKQSKIQIENAAKGKHKTILQFDLNGNFLKEWESTKLAAKELNLNAPNICNNLKGKTKYCGKFIWKFKL